MAFNRYSLDLEASSSQYAYIADNSALSITGNLSGEFWVKLEQLPSSIGAEMVFLAKADFTDGFSYRFYAQSADNILAVQYQSDGTTSSTYQTLWRSDEALTSADVGKWIHLAFTIDQTSPTIKIYKNGVDITAGSAVRTNATTIYDSSTPFIVGGITNEGSPLRTVDGLMSNVRIFNDVRTQTEIQDNMYSILTGTSNNLVGSWFNDANDYNDDAGTNNLTASGSPVFSTNVPWTGANTTDWSAPFEIQSDNTKVSGSSNHTDIPLLIADGNLSSSVYAGLSDGELNGTGLLSDSTLKAYYRFESGALTTDTSGNSHTLTAVSDPAETTGKFGGAVDLDGNDAYSITDHADLKPTTPFSVSLWVNRLNNPAEEMLFQSFSQNTNIAGFWFSIQTSGVIGFRSGKNTGTTNGTDTQAVVGTKVIDDGNWHHVVCSWNGSSLLIYVDGVFDNSTAWANAPAYAGTNYVRVGCRNRNGTNDQFLTGSLDDVALFNGKALTASEIKSLYQGGSDLRITTDQAGTTEVPFEIVSLNTATESAEIWAKVPTLSYNTNTSLYVWYGNSNAVAYDANAPFGSQNVWSDYNIKLPLQSNSNDSSDGNINGTDTDITYGTGKIGNGASSTGGSGDGISLGNVLPTTTGNATWSFWLKGNSAGNNKVIFCKGLYNNDGFYFQHTTGGLLQFISCQSGVNQIISASTAISDATWYKIDVVKDSTTIHIYLNGSEVSYSSGQTITNPATSSRNFYLFRYDAVSAEFPGSIDDFKVGNAVTSPDWIATEYNNQNSPSTFWIPGRRIFVIG